MSKMKKSGTLTDGARTGEPVTLNTLVDGLRAMAVDRDWSEEDSDIGLDRASISFNAVDRDYCPELPFLGVTDRFNRSRYEGDDGAGSEKTISVLGNFIITAHISCGSYCDEDCDAYAAFSIRSVIGEENRDRVVRSLIQEELSEDINRAVHGFEQHPAETIRVLDDCFHHHNGHFSQEDFRPAAHALGSLLSTLEYRYLRTLGHGFVLSLMERGIGRLREVTWSISGIQDKTGRLLPELNDLVLLVENNGAVFPVRVHKDQFDVSALPEAVRTLLAAQQQVDSQFCLLGIRPDEVVEFAHAVYRVTGEQRYEIGDDHVSSSETSAEADEAAEEVLI
jgi:hypothetical protein